MLSPYQYLAIALICTALWLFMFQEHIAAKIRQSPFWPLAWLAFIVIGGNAVSAWFNLYYLLK